jgi:hypothetical protein
MLKNAVRTSQKRAAPPSTLKNNHFKHFSEIIHGYCEKHKKHTNSVGIIQGFNVLKWVLHIKLLGF